MTTAQELIALGLTANEAAVYLACLQLGPASAQEIGQAARLNRVTVYGVVKGLMKKGFVHEQQIGKKRKIAAATPTKLWDVMEERYQQLKRQEKKLAQLVPQLKSLAGKPAAGTNITYLEGFEGMKNWASDALTTKGEMLEWTKIEEFADRFEDYLNDVYFPRKKELQIPTRFLFIDTPAAHAFVQRRYLDDPASPPMKARFVDEQLFGSAGFVVIYNNKFSVGMPTEMRAVIVEDELVADTMRRMHAFAWEHARGEVQNKLYPLKMPT